MEGQSNQDNLMSLMSSNLGGFDAANEVPNVPGDDPEHVLMAAGSSWNQTNALQMPWWIQTQEAAYNYVNCIAESPSYLSTFPCENVLESLHLPVHGTESDDWLSVNPELELACAPKSTDSPINMDALQIRFQSSCDGELEKKYTIKKRSIHAENLDSWAKRTNVESYKNVSEDEPRARVAATGFLSGRKRNTASKDKKERAALAYRDRRIKLSEKIDALDELLPHPTEGDQADVLDNVIDHIKYLQLQIKELCKRRLGGEASAATEPINFLEGYSHDLCDHMMLNESLEKMMGKLLEENPLTAIQLLEMKGLFILPMDFTEGLL